MDEVIARDVAIIDPSDGLYLETLPKDLGVFFIVVGIGGVLLPGPVGAPFLILGGVVLFPNLFHGLDRKFRDRFPKFHDEGMRQVRRFVTDLERRYPSVK